MPERLTQEMNKESNPKDAVGIKKVPFSTIPAVVMGELGLAMLEGALKYGKFNWRSVGVRSSVYYDAALRHLTSWYEGESTDPDSGLSHLVKAIACLVVVRDSELMGNVVDDRPPSVPNNWQAQLSQMAGVLIDKYPNPKEAYIKTPPTS